jgi:GT2 family glycosyltransferase
MTASRPRIAVVIPSLRGETTDLELSLAAQTWPPDEVRVVRGVHPSGRARNQGVASVSAPFLVFIDDDALPGSIRLIEQLVRPLLESPDLGVTGAARVLPRDASWFQRRVAAEIPRTVNPVPNAPLETNPPLQGYGHSLITTTCAALRRNVFDEAEGFSEALESGVDTDFFYRVRRLGYRFSMIADAYVEHPAPANLSALWRKFYWYGIGYGQEMRSRPGRGIGLALPTIWHRAAFLLAASLWLVPNVFVLYSCGYPHWQLGFRPFKALSTYAVAWGYVHGWSGKAS